MQRSIPCLFMRGGTSRGPFFLESDLPGDIAQRDAVLLSVMGSPDVRQIDGMGGADPLTSKAGMVRRGQTAGVDLEFLFAQVSVKEALVDTTPNCGNMLAAVVPFGIETGLVQAAGDVTTLRVLTRNTLKQKIESIRLQAGPAMNLGDVTKKVVPKMCLVAHPKAGGQICTRTFIPRDCHSAVGVLGAVTVATAAVLPGSVANRYALAPPGTRKTISVEHPSGEFSVILTMNAANPTEVLRAALLRTARLIMRGEVFVPQGH